MVQTLIKPQTSERQEVVNWLVDNNYPALPVAPAQSAEQYPAREKNGEIKRDKQGNPIPAFTGKNPSYLDRDGKPHLVNHRQYQSQLPSDRELREWFANPLNGVGTLGGWNNTIWLDLDVKQFASKQECDRAFWGILDAHQALAQTFLEESHSGGWRIGVLVKEKPNFTNFALAAGGSHVGEALGEGRFTVLAPTIGPSGNSYKSINRAVPVEVMSLESIGIYPTSTKSQRQAEVTPHPAVSYIPGSIPLEQLGNDTSREILQGSCPTGDRSEALATAAQEWYGWQNWARDNGIAVNGTPEDLVHYAGGKLGIDSDRINRILKTIDPASCHPAALHRGDEESCWKKIRRLDKATFDSQCPANIKDAIKAEWQRSNNATPNCVDFGSRDYPGAKSVQKLPLREAVQKARDILTTDSDEITTNIKLEEIREACGMSGYDWERKIIKPLKRDLEGDRFKLELLGLLQIDDPVERIRQQALMAPKYQMSAGLIAQAMQAMKQRTQTQETRALDLDELFDMESEALNWRIPGLLPDGETIVLAGAPKAGKTLLAIDAAYAVVTGESYFLGERVKQGKVLLVSTDESAKSTKAKLLNRGFRRRDKGSIKVLPTWDISQMGKLEELLEDFRPNLVIIDSLRRINKGSEISENSAEFADAIYTLKETLERYGAAGILIHHTNKDREALGVHRLRGSSAIAGAVWGTWQLDQIPKPDPNNKKKLVIDPKDPKRSLSVFARDIEGQSLTIELNPEDSSWTNLGELGEDEEVKAERETIEAKIMRVLEANTHLPGLSGKEIIELIEGDFDNRSIYNQLSRMETKRLISCKPAPGDKRYKIYSLPNCHTHQQSSTNCHTPKTSHTPPSPPPTEPTDDYYAETPTTQGEETSHQNSHQPVINTHQPNKKSCGDDYSNEELVTDSEIVINFEQETGGGCEEMAASVTVQGVTVVEDMIGADAPNVATATLTQQRFAIAPSPAATTEPDAPDPGNVESDDDLHGFMECHAAKPYPNPISEDIEVSKQRALDLRKSLAATKTKADLSALREENGGLYSKKEILFVQNWLKNFFPSEYQHMEDVITEHQWDKAL